MDHHQQPRLEVKQVVNTSLTRKQFRLVARDSCGATFDPPENDKMFFGHCRTNQGLSLIGSASYSRADPTITEDVGEDFNSPFYHFITYIFIKAHYKGNGYGSKLLQQLIHKILQDRKRPIRVHCAEKAVSFFEKFGFRIVGVPIETVCGGSPLFKKLYPMQKDVLYN